MRKAIRHPASTAVNIVIDPATATCAVKLKNISAGGLAFQWREAVAAGSQLTISMPQIWPDFSTRGTVAWCRENKVGFEAGVQFAESDDAFKARMVDQFCQI